MQDINGERCFETTLTNYFSLSVRRSPDSPTNIGTI